MKTTKLAGAFTIWAFAILAPALSPPAAFAADAPAASAQPQAPPYTPQEALKSIFNPHEQINDEGYVLWGTCTICHKNTPDPEKEQSIRDVSLRFDDDLAQLCYKCHLVKPHPAGDVSQIQFIDVKAVPDHLAVPSKDVFNSMRIMQKDLPVILPVEPSTGRIFCATCHNPHERGVVLGRADYGADSRFRLRSGGVAICQFCHRK